MKKHFVGIDLGTTNCALAFVPPNSAHGIPKPFGVVQLSQPDQVEELPLLPSTRVWFCVCCLFYESVACSVMF